MKPFKITPALGKSIQTKLSIAAPAICGISALHNVSMVTKEMSVGQSLHEYFEQVTKNDGIPNPLEFLKKFRDEIIHSRIKSNEKELAQNIQPLQHRS